MLSLLISGFLVIPLVCRVILLNGSSNPITALPHVWVGFAHELSAIGATGSKPLEIIMLMLISCTETG